MVAFSDLLGEWTAAQITDLDPEQSTAGVLELDWSGPRPSSVAELLPLRALKLTHHNWDGQLSHCNFEWVLPRSYQVIGNLPLVLAERSWNYSKGWRLGYQLFQQRRWDAGDRAPWSDPRAVTYTGDELDHAVREASAPRRDIRSLTVTQIAFLDCELMVERFPDLTRLSLAGDLGELANAASLNRLNALQSLFIKNLFGMTADDCLEPGRVPLLQALGLYNIPQAYAAETRRIWRPEIANGTSLEITGARKPEWVRENRDNPLRDWEGREHISGSCYKKAVAQYKATRRAILATLKSGADRPQSERLTSIGEKFAAAFNDLDGRVPFIETEEREDLFSALDAVIAEAEQTLGLDLASAREDLLSGVEAVRDW